MWDLVGWGRWDLRDCLCNFFFFSFGCAVRLVGFQFPKQGSNPGPLQWKHRVLSTGPPGGPGQFENSQFESDIPDHYEGLCVCVKVGR